MMPSEISVLGGSPPINENTPLTPCEMCLENRKCKYCGDEYTPNRENQRYCSKLCSGRYYRSHRDEAIPFGTVFKRGCQECGKAFETLYQRQVFCCNRCNYNRNGRKKYHRDKKSNPERAERHRQRRNKNKRRWVKKNKERGMCSRCGVNRVEGDYKLCEECYKELKKL